MKDVTENDGSSVDTGFAVGTEKVKTVITKLLNEHVDVIMPVAGPQTADCIKFLRKR